MGSPRHCHCVETEDATTIRVTALAADRPLATAAATETVLVIVAIVLAVMIGESAIMIEGIAVMIGEIVDMREGIAVMIEGIVVMIAVSMCVVLVFMTNVCC